MSGRRASGAAGSGVGYMGGWQVWGVLVGLWRWLGSGAEGSREGLVGLWGYLGRLEQPGWDWGEWLGFPSPEAVL